MDKENIVPHDTDELEATVLLAQDIWGDNDINFRLDDLEMLTGGDRERFSFISYFAAGGMGQISLSRDRMFNRIVAVKSLNEKYQDKPAAVKAFLEECQLNAQLDHPSIVPVYTMEKDKDGHWSVVMKMITGSSLSSFMKIARKAYEGKKLNARQERHALVSRLEYFLKICEAIEYCHSREIMHCDLKPNNILMGQYGEVYIMDWGCARKAGTTPEHFSGTPRYLPPEYLKSKVVTPLVDVYSLGKILYEMVGLARTQQSKDSLSDTSNTTGSHRIVDETIVVMPIKINPAMAAIIETATAPDPEKRYQSVKELVNDVRRFIYDEEISVMPDGPLRKLSRLVYHYRIPSILVISAFLCIFCATMFFAYFQQQSRGLEHDRHKNMMKRLRFQSYTEKITLELEQNFYQVQAQLLVFADNVVRIALETPDHSERIYDNIDYLKPETSPPGMKDNKYYTMPINVNYLTRFDAKEDKGVQLNLPGNRQFIDICQKVVNIDLSNSRVNKLTPAEMFTGKEEVIIQRLYVNWANGVTYSFPGVYEIPDAPAHLNRQKVPPPPPNGEKLLSWTAPYVGASGGHRASCRHPLYLPDGRYLGSAVLEFHLEAMLRPMLEANRKDPVHIFYYTDSLERVARVFDNHIQVADENGMMPDDVRAADMVAIADRLARTNYQQFTTRINGKEYFVAGAPLHVTSGILLQLIEVETMKTHEHVD